MNFCSSEEEETLLKMFSLLEKFLKHHNSSQGITYKLKEKISNFPLPKIQEPHSNLPSSKSKPKIIPPKRDFLTQTLSLYATYLDLQTILTLRKLNRHCFSSLSDYLKSERLVLEERSLVFSVFSLDHSTAGFSLLELKEFCLSQIPGEAREFISLNFEEVEKKLMEITKSDFRFFKDIKSFPRELDRAFRPFCKIFVKFPIFVKNSQGISEENWFETFRKLLTALILKPEWQDLHFFLNLMTETNMNDFLKDFVSFRFEGKEKLMKIEILIKSMKILISAYFSQNPFVVRCKPTKNTKIEEFIKKLIKKLKLINFARKIVGINEKMRIILDFKGVHLKRKEQTARKLVIPNEIFQRILVFLGNNKLYKLRSLSKDSKVLIEGILTQRLLNFLDQTPEALRKVIGLLGIYESTRQVLPQNSMQFKELKQSFDDSELFSKMFRGLTTNFEESSSSVKDAFVPCFFFTNIQIIRKLANLKINKNGSASLEVRGLFSALKFLYKNLQKREVYQLLRLIQSYNGLNFLNPENLTLKDYGSSHSSQRKTHKPSSPNKLKKGPPQFNQEDLIALTNKILPYLGFKDLYHWGLTSKLCRTQAATHLETLAGFLHKKIKLHEAQHMEAIRTLFRLRKLAKTDEDERNSSSELENINDLSALECLELKELKSLNVFPKKYEIFLKPFILLFPSYKREKFPSFQSFIKRKDFIPLMNSINIELMPHETVFLIEKHLYEFKDFFSQATQIDKCEDNTFYKIAKWLKALVSFFGKIRKYHVAYEECKRMRFPQVYEKVFEELDKTTFDLFVCLKMGEIFKEEN